MSMNICGAPSCWGVDDPKNPYLPPWTRVLSEASQAGYRAIELGPWGYIPNDVDLVAEELNKNGLGIVVGTIFHDLVTPENQPSVLKAVDDICKLITDPKMPKLPVHEGQKWPTPYLTVMDWGHDERDFNAGHSDRAPRMDDEQWAAFVKNVRAVCVRSFIRTLVPISSSLMKLSASPMTSRMMFAVCAWIPVICTTLAWIR